jgi:hypothetical protein
MNYQNNPTQMKAKELVISTALILLLGSLLAGCEVTAPKSEATAKKTAIEEFVLRAVAVKKEVKLSLKADRQGKQIKVTVNLENPNLKPITSVQAWLSYDPAKLQGKSVEAKDSAFDLMAPYNNTFDNQNGLVMLGRANTKPVKEKTIKVAELTFDVAEGGAVILDAYDYQEDMSGHVSANVLTDGKPFNILVKPDSPLLVIE